MKIKWAVLVLFAFAFVVGLATILPLSNQSLNWSINRLGEANIDLVKKVLSLSIDEKRKYISHLTNLIQTDSNLSCSLVLANASKDFGPFNRLLDEVRQRTKLLHFQMMPLGDLNLSNTTYSECIKNYVTTKSDESLCKSTKGPLLARFAPVFLYGENVGTLFIATPLLGDGQLEFANMPTESPTSIQLVPVGTQNLNEIYRIGELTVVGNFTPDLPTATAVLTVLRNTIYLCIFIGLLLVLLFIGLAARFAFLNPFHKILLKLDSTMAHVTDGGSPIIFSSDVGLIWENKKLAEALDAFVQRIVQYERKLIENRSLIAAGEKNAAIAGISRQVAHDIRSPLTALSVVLRAADQIPESHRKLLIAAVERINAIANDLLRKDSDRKSASRPDDSCTLDTAVKNAAQEVSVMARERNIEICVESINHEEPIKVPIGGARLERVLVNIITNALEASSANQKILVQVRLTVADQTEVTVTDQGKGIPPEVLDKLGKEEFTFGKENGNGLGIMSASRIISEAGGLLRIESTVGQGTQVRITMPQSRPAQNHVDKIQLKPGRKIVVIDDDTAIHEVWRNRLSEIALQQYVSAVHFMTADEFLDWMESPSTTRGDCQFFVDYDLKNPSINGLDIIEKFKIQTSSLLISAHASDPAVRRIARSLGVSVMPKGLLATAPISIDPTPLRALANDFRT